jgi:hypothetical protein
LTVDKEWRGGKRAKKHGVVNALHNELYPTPELHPGNALYALVCRVVLGKPHVTTKCTSIDSAPDGCHSLRAETGGDGYAIHRFREFVVYDKPAIKIEYVWAPSPSSLECQAPRGTRHSIPGVRP